MMRRTRLAAGTAAALALTLSLAGCGEARADEAASQAAVDYLASGAAGDHQRYCDLSVDGHEDRAKCLEYSRIANDDREGFASDPKAVRVQDWNGDGKAVVVEVVLLASHGAPRYSALGLVQRDGRWLVAETSGYLSSLPDEATVDQELA